MTSQTRGWMKNYNLHELEAVIARLSDAEYNDQGHYPFQNWQLLRRFLYNHAGFERDESVDPTGRSLLTADSITISRVSSTWKSVMCRRYTVPPPRHLYPRRRGTGEAGGGHTR
jgi:hypothetical protein